MRAFDLAWSIIKALPRESLYTQSDTDDDGIPLPSGYGQMPFRYINQTRHKTMHPAIQGMMDRVGEKTGPYSPRGRITDDDKLSYYQRILDVPTLDVMERTEGTGGYHMMGRGDDDPDISSWSRAGSMDDPSAYTRRSEDFARLDALEREKERLADTLNLKDMSGNLDFMNPKSEYEHLVTRGPDGNIRFPGYDDNGYFIF